MIDLDHRYSLRGKFSVLEQLKQNQLAYIPRKTTEIIDAFLKTNLFEIVRVSPAIAEHMLMYNSARHSVYEEIDPVSYFNHMHIRIDQRTPLEIMESRIIDLIRNVAKFHEWDFVYVDGSNIEERFRNFCYELFKLSYDICRNTSFQTNWIVTTPEIAIDLRTCGIFTPDRDILTSQGINLKYLGRIRNLHLYQDSMIPAGEILLGTYEGCVFMPRHLERDGQLTYGCWISDPSCFARILVENLPY